MKTLLNDLFELSNRKIKNQKFTYHRFLHHKIVDSSSRFSGIYGSRGVGKTTLLLQVADSLGL
ncbi:MAG: AAA family ATPase, partial [Campylobacterales bacterium]